MTGHPVRFTQIAAVSATESHHGAIFGLDHDGRLWCRLLAGPEDGWMLMPSPEDERAEAQPTKVVGNCKLCGQIINDGYLPCAIPDCPLKERAIKAARHAG